MGQIIRLPVAFTEYPDSSDTLDPAERVLLVAIRCWVEAYRQDEDPMPRLCHGLDSAGSGDAAFCIDNLMTIIARGVAQPITIHCPSCRLLSDDEKRLLHAASLAQAGQGHLAEQALRTALLSAQSAECALDPLQSLAALLAEAGMFFRRRKAPAPDRGRNELATPRETIH